MRIWRPVVHLLIPCLLLPVLSCDCTPKSEASKTTLDRVLREKTVRVGYANEAPYAYLDNVTGRLTGESPEITRVVLRRMGVTNVVGVLTEFGSLIPGLKAGRFDIIAAGMYITPARCQEIAFSNPTYSIGEAFIVLSGNSRNLHSYEDVAAESDATIGVVAGTVERDYARKVGISNNQIIVFPDAPSALAGVQAGRVDVYAGTSLTIQDLLDKDDNGSVERADPFTDPIINGKVTRGYGALGFRKQDTALLQKFNEGLAEFLGTSEHQELVRPFGFTRNELPGDVTAAQLCED